MKYYVKIVDNDIVSFGKAKKVPKNNTEVSEKKWNELKEILRSIQDKEGYDKYVHLHLDGIYEVEYFEIEEIEED